MNLLSSPLRQHRSAHPLIGGGGGAPHQSAPTRHTSTQLPSIQTIDDWIHLLHTHTHEELANLVEALSDDTCTPCYDDVSGLAGLRPSQIKHYIYWGWQSDLDVQDCMEGIFKLLRLNPSISLMQQPEMDQLLRTEQAPTIWSHSCHFTDPSCGIQTHIPTACGAWYKGERHFATFYICAVYWSIMDPLQDFPLPPPGMQRSLNQALRAAFRARNLPVPPPPAIPLVTTHSCSTRRPASILVLQHHRKVDHAAPSTRKPPTTRAPCILHLKRKDAYDA
jgi:hypothetical protein